MGIRSLASVLGNIHTHKLADHLRRRLILCPADFKELIAEVALYPDS